MGVKGRARRLVAPFENWRWENIPWRYRLVIAYLRPRLVLRALREWFRQVTVLPGDEFYLVTRDVRLTVREVKPGRVVCEVVSGCHLFALGGSGRAVPCIEVFPRRPLGWWAL